jgi:hypothetical protein
MFFYMHKLLFIYNQTYSIQYLGEACMAAILYVLELPHLRHFFQFLRICMTSGLFS